MFTYHFSFFASLQGSDSSVSSTKQAGFQIVVSVAFMLIAE